MKRIQGQSVQKFVRRPSNSPWDRSKASNPQNIHMSILQGSAQKAKVSFARISEEYGKNT